ncbi:Putative aminopeptidase FrvX [Hathewaya proteolytica DSM 3090]|uniref:Putative aminopeptidase FrvX n=1 Tax=Hathewaya proteolytica DSM 3090 TaxID=1121331 RepID=A0A1M6NS47_9CLOT|nr:M42 family metallopeptidase [Hathewaya proteolytica]SHJ98505.1 Putative aminopeptidase FrvX [Hathewaya proteolytica DSM 3090]
MKYNENIVKNYLQTILTTPSPSGFTNKVIDYIAKELDSLNVPYEITHKGGLIATLKGKDDSYAKTFSAHVDTLGAMVKLVKKQGTLEFSQVGGYMMNSVEGENCIIHTADDKEYTGTIQCITPSVHTNSKCGETPRVRENMEIVIDEKVFNAEDVRKLGIEVGDYVSFDSRTKITESGFVKSRHLDDKASVSILLAAIRHIVENKLKLPHTINFYISNYEEIGHGASAKVPANTVEFIAVDMGCPAPTQTSTEYDVCICAKDSRGPYDYDLRRKLVNLCKEENIPFKIDIYPQYGSDASAALASGNDIKTALIGAGIFASHGYERTHMDSIMATLDLVVKYCCK